MRDRAPEPDPSLARNRPRMRRALDACTSFAFVAAVAAPLLDAARRGGFESSARIEQRLPAPFPRPPRALDEAGDWTRGFDDWYADHFGLRTPLVRWHNRAALGLFHRSPHAKLVLGPTDWIFATESRCLEVYRGLEPFPARRLDGWRRMLEARAAWHRERGIAYAHALFPNKERVYPEHLPASLTRVGPTRVEELAAHLAEHSAFRIVDLFPALQAEKAQDGERGADDWSYFRLGTHWTDRGAYAAGEELLDALAELGFELQRFSRDDFEVVEAGQGDSFARSLYAADLLPQRAWKWRLRERRARYDEELVARNGSILTTERDDPGLPRAVIFHDSFGENLRPLLAERFSRAVFVWGSFLPEIVLEESPDLVLECYVDRTLFQVPPEVRLVRGDADARSRFAASDDVVLLAAPPRAGRGVLPGPRTRLSDRPDGLALRARRGSPSLEVELPPIEPSAGAVLRIEVTTAEAGSLDVLYGTSAEPGYERFNCAYAEVQAGRCELFVELMDDHLERSLLLSFPPGPTAVVVHSIELRSDATPVGAR